MYDLLAIAFHRLHEPRLNTRCLFVCRYFKIHASTTLESMADNVLTQDEQEFIQHNAEQIKQFANELFAGSIDISKRQVYQTIFLKSGGRQSICWTCGGSLKQLGKRLEQWL